MGLFRHPVDPDSLLGFVLLVGWWVPDVLFGKLNIARCRAQSWLPPPRTDSYTSYGSVNVMQRLVFDDTHFVSGYVVFTFGTFVGTLALPILPSWRAGISDTSKNAESRNRLSVLVNRFMAGVGSF